MDKVDYRQYAIDLVCRNFGVEADSLMSGKRTEEVVDARCALIHILTLQGMSKKQIKEWTGLNASSQSYLLDGFRERSERPWYRHEVITLIKDARMTSPIAFRAHNRDGDLVMHMSKFE